LLGRLDGGIQRAPRDGQPEAGKDADDEGEGEVADGLRGDWRGGQLRWADHADPYRRLQSAWHVLQARDQADELVAEGVGDPLRLGG
jgi:hypothetical protein